MEGQMGWWNWAGIIMGAIGVAAFVMAIQPFMQLCCGRPKLTVEFNTFEARKMRLVYCGLSSSPVPGILRKIGVRRDAIQGLTVSASIVDSRTKKTMMDEDFAMLLDAEGKQLNVVDIVTSEAMIMVWVAGIKEGDNKVVTALNRDKDEIELPPSEYICDLRIKSASVNVKLIKRFMVGSERHELYWKESSS